MISDPHFFGISECRTVIQEWSNENGEMGLYVSTTADESHFMHGFILFDDGRVWHQQYTSAVPNMPNRDLEIIAVFAGAQKVEALDVSEK